MKIFYSILFVFAITYSVSAQEVNTNWYSETTTDGVIIQNSYPKGGLYKGPIKEFYNYSYLVFYTRIENQTGKPFDININFSSEPIPIPGSLNTYVKLFLPEDKMTPEKHMAFSYGLTELKSLYDPTSYKKRLENNEASMFYVVGIFYQTHIESINEDKGGNRAEFILKDGKLLFNMKPQIELLHCGDLTFDD